MKLLLTTLLMAVIVTACNKAEKVEDTAITDPSPVANFRISNMVEEGTILEGIPVEFENTSLNAETFEWDFDNGTVSAERTPTGLIYRQCPVTRCIRLTIRTRTGRTATYSYCVRVRCR